MRIVIKIGTNLITQKSHSLNDVFIKNITDQIARLHGQNHEIVLVSSGAVAAGRSEIALKKEGKNVPYRQALSAVGQGILMHTYHKYFQKKKIVIAQALLTNADFTNRKQFLNTRNTLNLLLAQKVVPIINENDVTTYDEIERGDNDTLSAKVATMIGADYLIILTSVDGLMTAFPGSPGAKLIRKVEKITQKIKEIACDTKDANSRGGMATKIQAAEYATNAGCDVLIANGNLSNILKKALSEEKPGTFFPKFKKKLEGKRKWLQTKISKDGEIIVDEGAVKALQKKGSSLLPSGIIEVKGNFERGAIVSVIGGNKVKIGFGQVNYSSRDINKIKGRNSKEINTLLGIAFEDEIIHRDNFVHVALK